MLKPWEYTGRKMERNAPSGRRCDSTCTHWTPRAGTKTCLCPVCHEVFSTPSNFDRHRKDGWCLLPSSVGLKTNENGVWVGEVLPGKDLGFRNDSEGGDGDE